MSKQKRKKLTFWSKYKMPIIAIVAFSAIVYVIIYLVFKENGIFPVGTGLEKSDWLSFLGAYLSFIGTVIVSLIAIFQSIYYSELNERKDAENRKKEIQPIFFNYFHLPFHRSQDIAACLRMRKGGRSTV